jgi:hypothetical protein
MGDGTASFMQKADTVPVKQPDEKFLSGLKK